MQRRNIIHAIQNRCDEPRKGVFLILSIFALMGCFAFISLSVDIGYINLTKQSLQNAADAAALAAAQEITNAVNNAPPGIPDVTQYARDEARDVAEEVAALNGVYINKSVDVVFGQRSFNEVTQQFEITWNQSPSNVVKVIARRDNADVNAPDGRLKLFFAGVTGDSYTDVTAEAIAYVESRDLVVVHDFSRSMNFDSYFNNESEDHLSDSQIVDNLALIWNDLQMPNTGTLTFAPQYLTLSDTQDGIDASVTFKYDDVDVTTTGELTEVKVRYTDDSEQTFNGVSGTSATINGTKDIETVWVKATPAGGSGGSGGTPETVSSYGIDVTFSGDRKTASASSPWKIREVYVVFTDNSTYYDSYSRSQRWYNRTWNFSKEIDYMYLEVSDGYSYWYYFNATNGGGGSGSEVEIRFDDTNDAVEQAFGLTSSYPYPGGSWNSFINHARDYDELAERGYREMYGGLTLINYIMRNESGHWETPDLWKTRHYPFHAIKEGHMLLCDFLRDLGFDDHLGMVSYDTYHRWETVLSESDPSIPYVDISGDPINNDYTALKNIMHYKQAAHYAYATNMGGGLQDAIDMMNASARAGTQRAIILMTDGNTNTMDNGVDYSLPNGWDWDELLDYDGDGSGDYYTSSNQRRYVLRLAWVAREQGISVHTMAVGIDADRDLMRAIAHIANGHFIDVPGGFSVADMEADVQEAFHRIASFVPPAKLLNE